MREDHRAATELEEKNKQQLLLAPLQVHHRQAEEPQLRIKWVPSHSIKQKS